MLGIQELSARDKKELSRSVYRGALLTMKDSLTEKALKEGVTPFEKELFNMVEEALKQ